MFDQENEKIERDNSLLILDDDEPFLRRLSKAMEKRGFKVFPANSIEELDRIIELNVPNYAVIDLRLEDGTGLDAIEKIKSRNSDSKIVVLTGYGAISTAVAAVKIGATDYLSKPAIKEVPLLWGEWQPSYHQKILMKTKLLPKK